MADDSNFMQEIEDSLRAERMEQFWTRFGKAIAGVCATVLLLTIVGVVWKNHNEAALMQETHQITEAKFLSDTGKNAEALAKLNASSFHSPNLLALVAIRRAEALITINDTAKARIAYLSAVSATGADTTLRDYAALQSAILAQNTLEMPDFNKADNLGRPYSAAARETKAARLLTQGKKTEARILLESLRDDGSVTQMQRNRVTELLSAAGGEAK